MKYYAVKVGKVTGVFTSWDDCKRQVNGFSGAVYKSFTTQKEAEQFIEGQDVTHAPQTISNLSPSQQENTIEIYTDGSHEKSKGIHGYLGIGAWTKYNNIEYSLSLKCDAELLKSYDIEGSKVSNATMEILAFAEVLKRFYLGNITGKTLIFYCDYIGVEKFMSGEWEAKKTYIKKIRDSCLSIIDKIDCKIEFRHVKSHIGIIGNEKADVLAGTQYEINTFKDLILDMK